MRVYDPDLDQVTISTFDASNNATFASLILTTSTAVLDDFDIELNDQQYTLLPKRRGHDFVRLNIIFERNELSRIEILDHFNTLNQFKFSKVSTNQSLPEKAFELKVPEDTEIIDQRADSHNQSTERNE